MQTRAIRMATGFQLGDIAVDVVFKKVKHVRLSVHLPDGRVRISAPRSRNLASLRIFAISKLDWIRQQRIKIAEQPREARREYRNHESHYVWGQSYLLSVTEEHTVPVIELGHGQMHLRVRPDTDSTRREAIVEAWYREQLKKAIPPLIAKWEPVMGVKVAAFSVRQMKTLWGSCSRGRRTLRFNTGLARKPPHCLEYVVIHEMVHLLERTHNRRFIAFMDRFMPGWRLHREELNKRPVSWEAPSSPGE